jgi:hypothetical protein
VLGDLAREEALAGLVAGEAGLALAHDTDRRHVGADRDLPSPGARRAEHVHVDPVRRLGPTAVDPREPAVHRDLRQARVAAPGAELPTEQGRAAARIGDDPRAQRRGAAGDVDRGRTALAELDALDLAALLDARAARRACASSSSSKRERSTW